MKRFDQINVIPFIDIMLVLLAIVLTTATFISQGQLKIDVPIANNKNSASHNHQVIQIAIDKTQTLYYQQEKTTVNALEKSVSKLDSQQKITLSIHHNIPFQQFIGVLELLKKYNFKQLSIVTKQG